MKAPKDLAAIARLPRHGPLCPGSLMVFSSVWMTSTSTMLGLRPQEPLSCPNPRMGRQRDDIELRIWKDINGCSWHEAEPHAIHDRTGVHRRADDTRYCCRRSSGTRRGTRLARVQRAVVYGLPRLNAIR